MKRASSIALLVAVLSLPHVRAEKDSFIAGPVTNAANGHIYYLLSNSHWLDAEQKAKSLGAHLVTINDEREQLWVASTFSSYGNIDRTLLIGLNDLEQEGVWRWSSGQRVTYTNWRQDPGGSEPTGGTNENVAMVFPACFAAPGKWNDVGAYWTWSEWCGAENKSPYHGVVEVAPSYHWVRWPSSAGGNDHYYALTVAAYTNWFHAEAEANLFGGHLVSINSAEEQAFIEATFLEGHSRSNIYWIGLNDIVSEGTFVWSSGEAAAYTNWSPLEPNNAPPGEDAVVMNWYYGGGQGYIGEPGQWNDWFASDPPAAVYWFRGIIETPAVETVFVKIMTGDALDEPTAVCRTGVAWVDYDDDGHLDLFVSAYGGPNLLFHNRADGTFQRVTTGGLVTDSACCLGGVWSDYDNDGWVDLFVPDLDCGLANKLYHAAGQGIFASVSMWPFTQDKARSVAGAWADYDNDGFTDLFVANSSPNEFNFLYHNRGDGTFGKITSGSIVNEVVRSPCASWCDYDNDGDADLFVTSEGEGPNRLYRNNGNGSFTKVTSGVLVTEGPGSTGCAWADYDNDGFSDLFVARGANGGPGGNLLYRNLGNGSFVKVTTGPVVADNSWSVGCAWGDYDNDGFTDLFVCHYAGHNNALYRNNGDGTFSAVVRGSIVNDGGRSRGCAWGDFDNDGFLDLFVSNEFGEESFLYRGTPNGNHWLKLNLIGTLSNRSAIGAKVRADAVIRGTHQRQLRGVSGGSGFGSQNSLVVHFGLGDATIIDALRIEWPSGIVQQYENIAVDQVLTITEPPVLTALGMSWPGEFEMILSSRGGFSYQIERTSDLESWTPILLFNNVNGSVQVVDETAGDLPHAFYRAVEVPVSGPGLAGWWPGDGNAFDCQGRYDGQLHGNVTYAPGVYGQAFDISISGGWVKTAAPVITKTDDWTLETWVFWRGLDVLGKHVVHSPLHIGDLDGFGLIIADRGYCDVESWSCGKEGMLVAVYGGVTSIATGYYPKPNSWTHLALTRSAGVLHLYANGAEVFSLKTGEPKAPVDPVYIGHVNPLETFDGLVDEPRVWSRALTAGEIREIYRVGALRLAVGR